MGFSKWILRNGFGSPGDTARAIYKTYINIYQNNQGIDLEEAFSQIYFNRDLIQKRFGNNYCWLTRFYDLSEDLVFIEKDMPLFVWAVLCLETQSFRNQISDSILDSILEVIREEIEKKDRSLITLDYQTYKAKAIQFFNMIT